MMKHLMKEVIILLVFILHQFSFSQGVVNETRRCPTLCQCIQKSVNCSSVDLIKIPRPLPLSCQILLLGSNRLINLSNLPLLRDLHTLDLHHNKLRTVPDLSPMPQLSILQMDKNAISSLDGIQRAVGLKELSVTDNHIRELNATWFYGLENLEFLYLDKNNIELLPSGIFTPLKRLTTLTLSYNLIRLIDDTAFIDLDHLAYLYIDNNYLQIPPSNSLSRLSSLKIVTLSNNLMSKFSSRSISSIRSKEIELTKLPRLFSVDQEAFYNLKFLQVLHLHHNPKLTYLDPDAFVKCSLLHTLYLHNNNLFALDIGVLNSLPALQSISLYHNHLHCDCNIFWIREAIQSNISFIYNISFQHSDRLLCDTPLSMNARLLQTIPLDDISTTCSPTVIPFFNDSNQKELGDQITYECRSIGIPKPHIHWILSNGRPVNNTSNDSRIRLDAIGTLVVNHIKSIDSGTYTCVASNPVGCDTTSTVLRVHNKYIHIMQSGVATNFITLTWNGTGSTISSTRYIILYKTHGPGDNFKKITIRPFMHKYTITNLTPQTEYDFCIAYEHRDIQVKLHCIVIKTRHELFMMAGIKTVNKLTVIIALSVATSLTVIFCLCVVFIKRYNRRKQYSEAEGYNFGHKSSAASSVVGNISQIPLDNLYKLNSTQLCTSTTSLISNSNTANSNA